MKLSVGAICNTYLSKKDSQHNYEIYRQNCRDYIVNILKRQNVMLETISEQQKQLLEEAHDYIEIIDIYARDNDIRIKDNINISAHLADVVPGNNSINDPVQDFISYYENQIQKYEAQVLDILKKISDSDRKKEEVYIVKHIFNVLQAVIPAHYYITYKLWIARSATYKSLSYDLNISQKKIRQMLTNMVNAIFEIIEKIDNNVTTKDITPALLNKLLAENEIYIVLKKNEI